LDAAKWAAPSFKAGLKKAMPVHPADIQNRDGGLLVVRTLFGRYPF
jgi:hypothetical protein